MRYIWIPLVIFVLGGMGYVLLRTNQAPIVSPGEESAPAEEAVSPPPPPPENPVLSVEEFRTLGAEVMSSLPVKGGPKSGELTFPVLTAGEKLRSVAEAVQNEPTLASEALLLFRECAASGQHSDAVRGLCFAYFKLFLKQTDKPVPQGMIPPHVRTMAERLAE